MTLQAQSCVVITGSTRGIGLGLAKAFLKLNWNVVISGRNEHHLKHALDELAQHYSPDKFLGQQCNVTEKAELQVLWTRAIAQFGRVDVWINNAGSANSAQRLIYIDENEIKTVLNTNILGSMLGSQVALQQMLIQGFGQIFNMEGWGSRDEWSAGMTPYATSKRAVAYLNYALYKETKNTPVKVGSLSPGMVTTDLLIDSWKKGEVKNWHKMKRLFMFVIDPPEPVCQYLAERISQNSRTNVRIVWMTPLRLLLRFFQPHYWKRNPVKNTALDQL